MSEVIVLAPSMIGAMPLSQYGRDRVEISKIQDGKAMRIGIKLNLTLTRMLSFSHIDHCGKL